jgi:hypothetical protein
MFKQLATLVSGLMGRLFTAPSSLTAEQPSPSAKPLPVKSTHGSRQAVRSPAKKSPKPKSSAVQKTKAVASRKQTPKPAQPISGKAGSQAATPVLLTRQPAKPALT